MEEKNAKDEIVTCVKCEKQKKKSEGNFFLEGTAFCCEGCCGDPKSEEHKKKASSVCEFC